MTEDQVRRLFAEMLEDWSNRVHRNVVNEPLEHLSELMHGQAMAILEEIADE